MSNLKPLTKMEIIKILKEHLESKADLLNLFEENKLPLNQININSQLLDAINHVKIQFLKAAKKAQIEKVNKER